MPINDLLVLLQLALGTAKNHLQVMLLELCIKLQQQHLNVFKKRYGPSACSLLFIPCKICKGLSLFICMRHSLLTTLSECFPHPAGETLLVWLLCFLHSAGLHGCVIVSSPIGHLYI